MIAIEEKLPLEVKVKVQVQRRNALETLATKLAPASAGHNRDILDGSGQGSHQQDRNAAMKRRASPSLTTPAPPPKKTRRPPRNKNGKADVQSLITASRPTVRQALLQRPIPPNMRRVKYGYKTEFVHQCVATQHAAYWDADTPQILMPIHLTSNFSEYMGRNRIRFQQFMQGSSEHFLHTNALNCATPPITYIWSCAGCHVPYHVEYLEAIVGSFWRHGYPALLKFLGASRRGCVTQSGDRRIRKRLRKRLCKRFEEDCPCGQT